MLNKTNSFYHGPLSCYSKNLSFDQKYNYDFSNSNNNLFGNKKIYNNKKNMYMDIIIKFLIINKMIKYHII